MSASRSTLEIVSNIAGDSWFRNNSGRKSCEVVQWSSPAGCDKEIQVGVPLERKLASSPERKFYVLPSMSFQPKQLDQACIYFFSEFRDKSDTETLRRRKWLGKVNEAIKMELDKLDQSEGHHTGKVLGGITHAGLSHMKKTQMRQTPKLVDPVSATDGKAGNTTNGREVSKAVYPDISPAETSEIPQAIKETNAMDDEITVTAPTNQHSLEQHSGEPSRKRHRPEAEVHTETSIKAIEKSLDMLAITESNRAEEIAGLLNDAATPQNLQSMVSMYEHTIGTENTKAKIVFAHTLKEVTAALSAAKKERASMLKEMSEALKAYNERE